MSTLEIWLLAISLAMDCFTVSITSGIILKKKCWSTILKMAFFFGLFQAIMPLIGWFCTNNFNKLIESFDHWIAFILLALIGGKMIKESFCQEEEKRCFNPCSLKVILTLAVATSIDALAVGISFVCIGMNTISSIITPVIIIGIVSFAASIIGNLIGIYFGNRFKIKTELIGGIILIIIGLKILFQHLF